MCKKVDVKEGGINLVLKMYSIYVQTNHIVVDNNKT